MPDRLALARALHNRFHTECIESPYEVDSYPWEDVADWWLNLVDSIPVGLRVTAAGAELAEHVIEFRTDGWTIMHPLACRPALFDCPVNRAAERDLTAPPDVDPGRYVIRLVDGQLVIGEPVAE